MMRAARAALLWALVSLSAAPPPGSALELSLDTRSDNVLWTLENSNGSIKVPAVVPGGVYSDLQRAALIPDILAGFNDVETRWVAYDTFTYYTTFKVNAELLKYKAAKLVFHGVDTVGYIELNGTPVGSTDNMFVRYVFDVKDYLKAGENVLVVYLESGVKAAARRSGLHFAAPECIPSVYNGECHANQLRKMQASFSWDWGPAFPGVGLWKPVAIEFYNGSIIRAVTTHLKKSPSHWSLTLKVYLDAAENNKSIKGNLYASITVDANQTKDYSKNVEFVSRSDGTGEVEIDIIISANVVSTWWPNGYGEQPLYNLTLKYNSLKDPDDVSTKTIQVAFRTIELIEEDITNIIHNSTGEGLTFYFMVNDYPLFMKGSNWIPAHILPELGTDERTVDELVEAAAEAHMSMLRVWGGGVYESDHFYSRCDQLGILVWQDFMFACSMYPVDKEFLQSVSVEVEQAVLRLQHHGSVALWAGNNENEVALRGNWYTSREEFPLYREQYITLYVDTVRSVVQGLDPARRYLVSSPTNGIESEREGYIALNPYSPHYGDTHFYNYLADGWSSDIYPQTRFASEYGFQSLPSLETMRSATTRPEDYHVHSRYSRHRQHSPNGYIFIEREITQNMILNEDDPDYFNKFIFYSQISQAISIKTETEFYRQSRADWHTMGALYWQLNDVWQAPSWSSIEFGGKWKILHYLAKSFFAPVLVSPRLHPTGQVEVYLLNDRLVPVERAEVLVQVYNWTSFKPLASRSFPAAAPPLSAAKLPVDLSVWNSYKLEEIFLKFSLKIGDRTDYPVNHVFPAPFKRIVGLSKPKITITVTNPRPQPDGTTHYAVNVVVNKIVLMLWLEAEAEGLRGRFQENGFVLSQPYLRVNYISKHPVPVLKLQSAITYQYYLH